MKYKSFYVLIVLFFIMIFWANAAEASISLSLTTGDTLVDHGCTTGGSGGLVTYAVASPSAYSDQAYCPWNGIGYGNSNYSGSQQYKVIEVADLADCAAVSLSTCEGFAIDEADIWTIGGTTFSLSNPNPPSPSDATSSIEQIQNNLYNGFIIFFITMFGIIWMFKRK